MKQRLEAQLLMVAERFLPCMETIEVLDALNDVTYQIAFRPEYHRR